MRGRGAKAANDRVPVDQHGRLRVPDGERGEDCGRDSEGGAVGVVDADGRDVLLLFEERSGRLPNNPRDLRLFVALLTQALYVPSETPPNTAFDGAPNEPWANSLLPFSFPCCCSGYRMDTSGVSSDSWMERLCHTGWSC